MNLLRKQSPYRFIAPKYSPWFQPILRMLTPMSLRIQHKVSNVEAVFSGRLSSLESSITWKPRVGNDAVTRIMDLGSALLSIKEEEYFGAATAGSLEDRLTALRSALVGRVEKAHNALNESMSTPKRIKAIRALIRKELTSEENPPSLSRSETLYDQLDQVFLAHQLYSYPGIYLLENPSRHRIAETIFKLEEDVFGKGRYLGAREAEVVFDTPIEIESFLSESGMNVKTGVGLLTELTRERIQKLMAS